MIPEPSHAQSADDVSVRVRSGLNIGVGRFGKVVDADITLAPLTILVGKNNTGKSYIASLIWCISNIGRLLRRKECEALRPSWVSEFFAGLEAEDFIPREVLIDRGRREELIDWVNRCFIVAGRSYFGDMFAFDGFEGTKVTIRRPAMNEDILLAIRTENVPQLKRRQAVYSISRVAGESDLASAIPLGLRDFDIANYVMSQIVGMELFGFSSFYMNATYIPAARTGLMIAFRTIVSQLFERASPTSNESARLQMPQSVIDFLSGLTYDYRMPESPKDSIANWLEKRLIGGALRVSDEAVPTITYKPNDSSLELPLYAASSMITEVAPILLAIRRSIATTHIILEEPEAHLHLSAQRLMAQAIARLVNAGIKVLITTHSDTLIQQLNNLMKLHKVGLQDDEDYEQADIIDPDCVAGYEFITQDRGTHVRELEMRHDGLVVQSINETLIDLADETINLNEAMQDD